MSFWLAHLLFAVLLLVPWQSRKGIRLLDELVVRHADARLSFYRDAIVGQWVLAVLAIAALWHYDADYVRTLTTLRLDGDALAVVGTASLVLLSQSPLIPAVRRLMARSAATRRALWPLRNILPRSDAERRMWVHVALTAGICEEILFRAFLFFYATAVLDMETVGAVALSSAVFAFGHSYQGTTNMLRVAIAGLLLGVVFAVTESLVYCVILHAVLDLGALQMGEFVPADRMNES